MEDYSAYVGLDVHKEMIAVAVAYPGRSEPMSLGNIANTKKSVVRLIGRLSAHGEALGVCYEAGPCGYEVYRWVKEQNQDCMVVAPSKIPRKDPHRVRHVFEHIVVEEGANAAARLASHEGQMLL